MSENTNTQTEESTPSSSDGPQASSSTDSRPASGLNALLAHISQRKIDFALWSTRLLTIVFSFNYLIPIFGNAYSMYSKALLANAATSALRLHQRLPRVAMTREFFGQLFMEDSAHYLLYSMMFLYSVPITWVLLPVFLFALLHISSSTLEMIEILGPNSLAIVRMGIGIVEVQSANILRTIAFAEIFLFPMVLLSLFSGRSTLMTIFVYYRFLTMRYASRRNPYSRTAFYELRVTVEHYAQRPGCPGVLRSFATKAVAFITRLAPALPAQS